MELKPKKAVKYWEMNKTDDNVGEISIYGEIVSDKWYDDETSAISFKSDLDELGDVDTINLHINSPGGSVFEGIAIHNMLKMHKATVNVYVDGLAASIASVIAMSGDTIFMPENAMLMIHNPWTFAVGNAKELRKQADDLDRIAQASIKTYLSKSNGKIDEETLTQLLDEETWLSAQEAFDYGLADEVLEANQAVASLPGEFLERYKRVPSQLRKESAPTSSINRQKLITQANNKIAYVNNTLGGINKWV